MNARRLTLFALLAAALLLASCGREETARTGQGEAGATPATDGGGKMTLKLTSAAFEEGGMIPSQFTCDGKDISPQLAWASVPDATKTLALVCDDPDAPRGTWVHWVVYNLPPTARELPEGVPAPETLENGARQGTNDFRKTGYGGPCPPSGTHRYFFRVYALDAELNLPPGATKQQLLDAMQGHILAEGQLMGRYKR